MTRQTLLSTCLLLSLAGLTQATAWPAYQDDDEHATAAVEHPPHTRAPGEIDVSITADDWVRAPGEDWFETMAEQFPDRFSYSEEAAEYTDEDGVGEGDFEGGWIDAKGEYVFRYDIEEDEFAYWQKISAKRLTSGRTLFVQYCASCHGFTGDGYGRSAQHLRPPPRSFHQSNFKFTHVIAGNLPSDDALTELILNGLDGTPMYPWALQDNQVRDIVQYIKTLSPPERGWRDVYAEIADVVDIGEDPFANDPAAGAERGAEVYHLRGCYNCHPGYLSPDEIAGIAGNPPRDDFTYPKIVPDSGYEVLGYAVSILPPDFTWHTIRRGKTASDIAHTVAAGIGGAGMPQWKGSISDEEIWAMGHYVRSLIDDYHGQPAKRAAFMATLRN
ncbi:MAG: hypothetical protein DHS20C15_28810 [Planctomycetota bacterium]|nr:MAG: hypothetical protein DHS20C15_28810 [Planctomycetota bacterium]